MRILLVDDAEDSRDLTEAALLSAGYDDIVTAASGWEALKILDVGSMTEPASFDLMLLDIVMPEMDGVEACARVRNDARYADLPIIMVTALDDMDSLANAFVAGATDYITKPVNRVELVARVRAALRLKQELDRRQARERELLGFLSNWGDRRASTLIDEATGLFVGEAAEAYLTAAGDGNREQMVSILALMLDRLDVYRSVNGEGAVKNVLAQVARAVRRLAGTVGLVAAAYRNGTIILVAPELAASAAREFGETLCATVAKLQLPNSEAVASDHVTASVAAVTGRAKLAVDRVHLLT
ncbi:MAG: response regulator, partial [Xanthobacteraceae bacterium]